MASFAKVPGDLVTDPAVSDMAVRFYAALCPHVWRFEKYADPLPSMAQLAEEVGRSVDSAQRCISELDAAGWLDREVSRGNRHVWMRLNNRPIIRRKVPATSATNSDETGQQASGNSPGGLQASVTAAERYPNLQNPGVDLGKQTSFP